MSEEKAQCAMIDATRLAEELRLEEETTMGLESNKTLLEAKVSYNTTQDEICPLKHKQSSF